MPEEHVYNGASGQCKGASLCNPELLLEKHRAYTVLGIHT